MFEKVLIIMRILDKFTVVTKILSCYTLLKKLFSKVEHIELTAFYVYLRVLYFLK